MKKNKRIIAIIALFILFGIIAIVVNTKNNLYIDEKIYNIVSLLHTDIITKFFRLITHLGNAILVGFICMILVIIKKTRYKVGIPITLNVFIAGIFNILLKNIFERQRPLLEQLVYEDSFSFPSGHSMVTSSIYSMVIYLSCKYIKNIKIKNTVNIVSILIIFLVGISRVYLRVHYFSDVIAGWILGIIITIIFSLVIEKIEDKKLNNK